MAFGASSETDGPKESKRKKVDNNDKKKVKLSQYACKVFCLDGSEISSNVDKSSKGEVLFNNVVATLSITQKEYMGLLFFNETGVKCWLDIHKEMKHQIGDADAKFYFRIKFYEPEPTRIYDEFTRYLLYLQLRDDFVNGRLLVSQSTYAILGSYTLQAEVGDFNFSDAKRDYLRNYQFSPNDDEWILDRVYNLHKDRCGQSPAQAELNFLEIAKKVPKYGVDMHHAYVDLKPVEVGVAALGINIYEGENRKNILQWQSIDVLSYKKRKMTVKLKQGLGDEDNKKKPKSLYCFLFDSAKLCKQCYKSCVEYHTFFRLTHPDSPRKKTDKLKPGSSFRYSDRTLYQLRQRSATENSSNRRFNRTPSIKSKDKNEKLEPQKNDSRNEDKEVSSVLDVQVQYEEVDIDSENYNDRDFDPKEWEIVDKVCANGVLKKICRRKIPLKYDQAFQEHQQDKKETFEIEYIPLQYEEIEFDKQILNHHIYDPLEWQEVEKKFPDGEVKYFLRKNIVVQIKKFVIENNKKYEVLEELPLHEEDIVNYEEVLYNDHDSYDKKEWEIVEKPFPDGTKKLIRRKTLSITPQRFVTKKDGEKFNVFDNIPVVNQVSSSEFEASSKDIELNDTNPESLQYNANEWEVVKQYYPDGSKKTIRRPRNAKAIKQSKILVKENANEIISDANVVFVEEISPKVKDRNKVIPEEGSFVKKEEIKKSLTAISTKPFVFEPFIKEECPYEDDPVEYEEVDIDPNNPESLAFDLTVWEVIERKMPDGKIKKVRRRVVIVKKKNVNDFEKEITSKETKEIPVEENLIEDKNVYQEYGENDDEEEEEECAEPVLVEEGPLQYEEFEIIENQPNNIDIDPSDWEIVQKENDKGEIRKCYRRMIGIKTIKMQKITHNSIGVVSNKFNDTSAPILVEEIPVEYEEFPLDNSDLYDPKDWEIVEKTQPNMQIKRCRRRIIVKPLSKNKFFLHPDGNIEPVSCENLKEDGPLLFYLKPHQDLTPVQPNEEVVAHTANSTTIKVCQQFVATKQVKAFRIFIHADGSRDIEQISQNAPSIEEELSVKCEEVDETESTPLNNNEWQSAEVLSSSGVVKKIRRRILPLTLKKKVFLIRPNGNKEEVCDDSVEQDSEWEEIMESDPAPSHLNPNEWQIEDRLQPDGSIKRFKCRIKVTSEKKVPEIKSREAPNVSVTPQKQSFQKNDADKNSEEDPKQWEVIQSLGHGSVNIRVRQRPVVSVSSYRNNDDSESDVNESMDDILSQMNDLSKSLAEDDTKAESDFNSSLTISINKKEHFDKQNELIDKEKINLEERQRINLEERQDNDQDWKENQKAKVKEEEMREANKVELSSLFNLPDIDDESFNDSYKNDRYNDNEVSEDFSNNTKVIFSINMSKLENKTHRNSYKSDSFLLDRKHSSLESDVSSVDEPETRYVVTRQDQADYRQPLESGPHTEILYTVTDVSNVEQGRGGFVKAVREKHENIASVEKKSYRLSLTNKDLAKVHHSDLPKGHVPTKTMSFKENADTVIITYNPPSVDVKATIVRPASSELPDEENLIINKKVSEESCLPNDFIESSDVPVVDTHSVVFMEPADVERKICLEDVLLETKTLQIQDNDTQLSPQNVQIITRVLPTEVITQTIVYEADHSLSQDELDGLLDKQTITSTTVTTTVQKISGETVTHETGYQFENVPENAIEKAIHSALFRANNCIENNETGFVVTEEGKIKEEERSGIDDEMDKTSGPNGECCE
ncbi:uncharacterized protein LOC100206545 isoform X3 [Hydra vulgaris]|uniref:Uncharacterized protein LOC100206545 isoform X3 n=1 Tax=Hydra vulgaris TaxID=6087 RepID=A0ABM4D8V6_HYDVU